MSNFDALDMALDDVISQNRKQRKLQKKSTPVRGGSVKKNTITKKPASAKQASQQNNKPIRNITPVKNNSNNKITGKSNSLVVSNLHFNVTEKDLYELFGQIGPLRRAFLHIAPNGKSAGIADVVFKNNQDAEKARNTYNNVELDGRPMRITVASITGAVAAATNNIKREKKIIRSPGRGLRGNRNQRSKA